MPLTKREAIDGRAANENPRRGRSVELELAAGIGAFVDSKSEPAWALPVGWEVLVGVPERMFHQRT